MRSFTIDLLLAFSVLMALLAVATSFVAWADLANGDQTGFDHHIVQGLSCIAISYVVELAADKLDQRGDA